MDSRRRRFAQLLHALSDQAHAAHLTDMVSFVLAPGRGMRDTMQGIGGIVSHQTARLARGRHRSPEHGTCAMELASMLAGEKFSDRPRSVSHVLAAFVRMYNDLVDDRRRTDLYAYTASAVGTRGPRRLEATRAQRCVDWLRAQLGDRARFELWAMSFGPGTARKRELIAEHAARYAASSRGRHEAALALIDELIRISGPGPSEHELELVDLRAAGEAVGDHERALAGAAHGG